MPHDRVSARVERGRTGLMLLIAGVVVVALVVLAHDLYKAGMGKINHEFEQVQTPPR